MISKGEKLSLKNCSKYNYLDEDKYYNIYYKRLSEMGYEQYCLRESWALVLPPDNCEILKYHNRRMFLKPFRKIIHIMSKIHL